MYHEGALGKSQKSEKDSTLKDNTSNCTPKNNLSLLHSWTGNKMKTTLGELGRKNVTRVQWYHQ